jgi:hypothetical protein
MMAASTAMTVAGGISQANAQRAAGDAAYQNALMRARAAQTQAQIVAQQDYANASSAAGAGQIQADQERQRAAVLAGRAKAVMAASGAGVDPNLVASLVGQGNYNSDVALYNGNEKARNLRNHGDMALYNADYNANSDLYSGETTQANDNAAAGSTIIGAAAKGLGTFASYYGAGFGGGGGGVSPVSPDAAMAAYNSAPASFTRPGMDIA